EVFDCLVGFTSQLLVLAVSGNGSEDAKGETRGKFIKFGQITNQSHRGALFDRIIADGRCDQGLELLGGLRLRLVDECYVGQYRACRRKNQGARERVEDFKPVFRFWAGRAITAMRAITGVLSDRAGTFFAF